MGERLDPHRLPTRFVVQLRKCRLTNMETLEVDGWAALGDPTRREIFQKIADRPRAVGQLAGELPVSRPAVSQHLKVLKRARLVSDERAGNRRIYRINPAALRPPRRGLEEFWGKTLAAYKEVAEKSTQEDQ